MPPAGAPPPPGPAPPAAPPPAPPTGTSPHGTGSSPGKNGAASTQPSSRSPSGRMPPPAEASLTTTPHTPLGRQQPGKASRVMSPIEVGITAPGGEGQLASGSPG